MKIIIILMLFVAVAFPQRKHKKAKRIEREIERVYEGKVLKDNVTNAIVRKVHNNYVIDLIKKTVNAKGDTVITVLATDRTYELSKIRMTKKEKDKLDGRKERRRKKKKKRNG